MKYCSQCGIDILLKIPAGDDRERFVCESCDLVFYNNPRMIVGCLPEYGDKVLLCKRAIEPRAGYWTLPAGFMENGETTVQGAARETWEEARAKVSGQELYRLFDIPNINQVYMFYRCALVDGEYGVGPESSEVGLFSEDEIPWDDIAFPVMYHTLKEFFSDRREGHYPVRVSSIQR